MSQSFHANIPADCSEVSWNTLIELARRFHGPWLRLGPDTRETGQSCPLLDQPDREGLRRIQFHRYLYPLGRHPVESQDELRSARGKHGRFVVRKRDRRDSTLRAR